MNNEVSLIGGGALNVMVGGELAENTTFVMQSCTMTGNVALGSNRGKCDRHVLAVLYASQLPVCP
jgi:hypothetical protein